MYLFRTFVIHTQVNPQTTIDEISLPITSTERTGKGVSPQNHDEIQEIVAFESGFDRLLESHAFLENKTSQEQLDLISNFANCDKQDANSSVIATLIQDVAHENPATT